MKAFVIPKPFQAEICEKECPRPSDNEVLIRVAAAGFCGTDIHTYKGEHVTEYPIIPGHEFSGIVAETGRKVTQFKEGDRVLADPNIFCEKCNYCRQNKQIHCKNIQVVGNTRNGAFAEYVTVPEQCVFSADGIDLVQASMAEPLACCINAHNKFTIPVGAKVLITGAGTIGLMHLLLTKRRGASMTIITDLKQEQLHLAEKLGADRALIAGADIDHQLKEICPEGFDIIIDATGAPKVIENTIPLLAETGVFVFFGACPTVSEIRFNPFEIYYHDWKFIGSYALQKNMGQSISMLKNGLDLSPLIGETISIDEMPEVFEKFVNGETNNKVIVTFDNIK